MNFSELVFSKSAVYSHKGEYLAILFEQDVFVSYKATILTLCHRFTRQSSCNPKKSFHSEKRLRKFSGLRTTIL